MLRSEHAQFSNINEGLEQVLFDFMMYESIQNILWHLNRDQNHEHIQLLK